MRRQFTKKAPAGLKKIRLLWDNREDEKAGRLEEEMNEL
jgi:hypothetical protein